MSETPPRKSDELRESNHLVNVFLDGIQQHFAIDYDMDEGWVRRGSPHGHGIFHLIPSTNEVESEVVYGRVNVEWAKPRVFPEAMIKAISA